MSWEKPPKPGSKGISTPWGRAFKACRYENGIGMYRSRFQLVYSSGAFQKSESTCPNLRWRIAQARGLSRVACRSQKRIQRIAPTWATPVTAAAHTTKSYNTKVQLIKKAP